MQFADLEAPSANLVLGTGTGVATGFIRAGTLLIVGAGGRASLVGSVNGDSGPGAAALARIRPAVDPAYMFNLCTIGTTICTPLALSASQITSVLGGLVAYGLLPTDLPPLPVLPELVVIALPSLPAPPKQLTNPDVVPPNISVQDY
jgi:hypothetical protein